MCYNLLHNQSKGDIEVKIITFFLGEGNFIHHFPQIGPIHSFVLAKFLHLTVQPQYIPTMDALRW